MIEILADEGSCTDTRIGVVMNEVNIGYHKVL